MRISMTTWQYIIVDLLKSRKTKSQVRKLILENCLLRPDKKGGHYWVDNEKVFDLIISQDPDCLEMMKKHKINDIFGLYSFYDSIEYRGMRATYPRRKSRRGM